VASAPIGEIPVLITGDWSELQTALDAAVKASELGAQEIAAAFSSSSGTNDLASGIDTATEAINSFDSAVTTSSESFGSLGDYLNSLESDAGNAQTAVEGAGAAIGTLGTDAETAGGQVENLSPPLEDVHQHGGEAESAIGELGEKFTELGEALAVAEVLKEFAEDALETYANVQKANISLTALTGDAALAKEQIEELKTLALDNALSFETLVGAAQKMTALGFSTGQVNSALQTAGDTAAATGGSFDKITGAIDRLTLSGTAGAKQLVALGISAGKLASAMGVAAGDVTTAFKALDQSERLAVLEQALSKFSGVAEQVASGISGQWQNLKTQWEFVLEDMGQALAPLASQVMQLFTGTIIPAVNAVVSAFGNLPPALQGVVIAAGVLIPAIYAIQGALGVLTEIFPAIGEGAALLGPVVGTIGLIGAALVGMHLAGIDSDVMNLYHALADNFPNIPGIFGNIGTAVEGVAKDFNDWLQKTLNQTPLATAGLSGMQDQLDRITPSISRMSLGDWIMAAVNPSKMLKTGMGELADVVQYFGGTYQSMSDEVKLQVKLLLTANDQYNHSLAESVGAFNSLSAPITQIAKDYQTLKDNLALAQTNLHNVQSAFNDGTASAGQLASALKAVDAAQVALNPDWITAKQAAKDLDTATKDLNSSQTTLDSLLKAITPNVKDVTSAENNLKQAQANAEQALSDLASAQQKLNSARAGGAGNITAIKNAEDALKGAEQAGKQATTELTQAQKDATQAQKDATTVSKEQAQTDSDYANMLNTLAKEAVNGYAVDVKQLTDAQNNYKGAVQYEGQLQDQLNAFIKAGQQDSSDYKTTQLALADAHKQVTTDLKTLNTTSQDYNSTSKAILSAQKDIVSSEDQLDSIYLTNSIPNVKDLTGQLQALRDAKTQVTGDTNAQQQAESNLQDTLDDYMNGNATLAELTQAQNDLDAAKKQTTADNKDLKTTETNLTTAFGITKQAMQDITNTQNTMKTSTQDANAAFSALGIQSAQSLQTLADKATTAFNSITQDGTSSPHQIQQAQIAMLQAVQAAYISEGTNLSSTQQSTLTQLLNQQTDFNNSMINQWHNLYVTIEGDVSQLSNQLVTALFTGSGSFGKDAIQGLEKIATAFVSTLIQPVTAAIGKFIAGALTNLISGFGTLASTATQTGSTIDLVFAGQAGGSAASGAASSVSGILSAATTSLSGIVNMVSGIVSAVAGIIGDIETAHSNTLLSDIEHETARMAIYLGDQGAGSILGLMWRLVGDIEYGEIEKDMNLLASYGLRDLDAISGNSTYSLEALNAILSTLEKGTTQQTNVNVAGSDLNTVIEALDIINTTLVAESQTIPWFQTALQNINNGIVACAGWLQGIAGILQAGISVAGSTTTASSSAISALAGYIGQNFTSLETWLFDALGKTMALPALPSPVAIPSALGGAATAGGVVINLTNTVNGSVVGQNGMNQLTTTIANNMVAKLRNSGLKY